MREIYKYLPYPRRAASLKSSNAKRCAHLGSRPRHRNGHQNSKFETSANQSKSSIRFSIVLFPVFRVLRSRPPYQHFIDLRRDPHTKPQRIQCYQSPSFLQSTSAQHPARVVPLPLQTNRVRPRTSRPSVVGSSPITLKNNPRNHKPNYHLSTQ